MHFKLDQTPITKLIEFESLYKVAFDQNWSVVKKYRENTFGKFNKPKIQTESQVPNCNPAFRSVYFQILSEYEKTLNMKSVVPTLLYNFHVYKFLRAVKISGAFSV